MPVGGSRFYGGAGLGQEGIWGCPSCGEDNTGPISQGCVHCGAGRPGHKAAPPPPPPAPPEVPEAPEPQVVQGDVADYWASRHADVSIAEAYRAGYLDGVQAARAAARQAPSEVRYIPDQKINRTIIAALTLFKEQVLVHEPDEIDNGEWLSVAEVDLLLRRLQLEVQEPAHV